MQGEGGEGCNDEEGGDSRKTPEPPDREPFETALARLDADIAALRKEYRSKEDTERSKLRAQLDEAARKIEELQERKASLLEGLDSQKQEPVFDDAEVDACIAALEERMYDPSLSLAEEKQLVSQIAKLKKNKRQLQPKDGSDRCVQTVQAQVEEITGQMRVQRERRRALAHEYRNLLEVARQDIAQREGVQREIAAKLRERRVLEEDFHQQEAQYKAFLARAQREKDKEAKRLEMEALRQARLEEEIQRQRDRQEAFEKAREARLKQQEAEEIRAREMREEEELSQEPPYFNEVVLLEQTLKFCRALMPKVDEKASAEREVAYNNPDGTVVLPPREKQRDKEYLMAPIKPLRNEGKVSKKKTKIEGAQAIRHDVRTLALFDDLQLEAPFSTEDLPATVAKLEERLAERMERIAEWEAKCKKVQERKRLRDIEQARTLEEIRQAQAKDLQMKAMADVDDMLKQAKREREEDDDEDFEGSRGRLLPADVALKAALDKAASLGASACDLAEARAYLLNIECDAARVDVSDAVAAAQEAED